MCPRDRCATTITLWEGWEGASLAPMHPVYHHPHPRLGLQVCATAHWGPPAPYPHLHLLQAPCALRPAPPLGAATLGKCHGHCTTGIGSCHLHTTHFLMLGQSS